MTQNFRIQTVKIEKAQSHLLADGEAVTDPPIAQGGRIKLMYQGAIRQNLLRRPRKLLLKHVIEHTHRMYEITDMNRVARGVPRGLRRNDAVISRQIDIVNAHIGELNLVNI